MRGARAVCEGIPSPILNPHPLSPHPLGGCGVLCRGESGSGIQTWGIPVPPGPQTARNLRHPRQIVFAGVALEGRRTPESRGGRSWGVLEPWDVPRHARCRRLTCTWLALHSTKRHHEPRGRAGGCTGRPSRARCTHCVFSPPWCLRDLCS